MDEETALRQMQRGLWQNHVVRTAIPAKGVVWTEELQMRVMNEIIRHPRTVERPPSPFAIFNFLKLLNSTIEESGEAVIDEILEEIVERLAQLPKRPEDGGPPLPQCYLTWDVPVLHVPDNLMSMRVAPQFNEVGLTVWDAGLLMFEYIATHQELFSNRRVLEFGSGLGTSGVALSAIKPPPTYTVLSDVSPEVLQNLQVNMQINDIPHVRVDREEVMSNDGFRPEEAASVKILHLDMLKFDTALIDVISPDVVIAADVLYCPEIADEFPLALVPYAKRGCDIVVAAKIRNEKTFDAFVEGCKKVWLDLVEIDISQRLRIFSYEENALKLFSIALGAR